MIAGDRIEFLTQIAKNLGTNNRIWDFSNSFRRVTSQDILRIIAKFGNDFEICGYKDTLDELKRLARKKAKSKDFTKDDSS